MFERLLTLPKPVGKLQRDYNKSVKNTLKQRKSQEKIHNLIMHGQCTPKLYENILVTIKTNGLSKIDYFLNTAIQSEF
jgi:hypothetical protein